MDLIRVGSFEVYPSERLLCSGGKPVEVGSRAFDLLLALAETPGCLVTKATLIERVWPRLVVEENNLPAQIACLRRVLGAGAIRTVPRFGYRLDLPVSRSETTATIVAPPLDHKPALAIPRRNWGGRLAPLVGRSSELTAIRQALAREALVTLVGGAGVGKSRLAQEVLRLELEQPGAAAAWVSLEPLEDAVHVPSAIAIALGLSLPEGSDPYLRLRQAIADVPLLLVLDGAEHLAEALAAPLEGLVAETPGLRVLVTSQIPLGRIGESVYRLAALAIPDAVELFGQRARQADQRFELDDANAGLVTEICGRLDGNPLAVELAAARVPAFGLAALHEHLSDRFRLLKLGAACRDPRHGVLQAAFDWSYGLLPAAEQRLFDRLGAFAAGFSLDAAARTVADESMDLADATDRIGRLVDRSLVTRLPTEPVRYTLLETARCYARARLESAGTLDAALRRLAETMLHVLDRAYDEYWFADEEAWLHQYEPELDNVRAALDWSIRHDSALAVSLSGSAWPLFVETDLHAEGRAGHGEVLALLSDGMPLSRLGRYWEAAATYDSDRQGDRARYAAELAARMHATTGNVRSQYYATMQLVLNRRDDDAGTLETFRAGRGLADPAWPARLLAHGAMVEGRLLAGAGKYDEARAAYRRALDHALSTSERQALAATVNIVELDVASGAIAAALQLGRPLAISLRHSGRRETRFELLVLTFSALLLAGELDEARALGIELYELAQRLDSSRLYLALDAMTLFASLDGRDEAAARVAAVADAACESHGQIQRPPAGERVRNEAHRLLSERMRSGWRSRVAGAFEPVNEESACQLALGIRA